MTGPRLEAGEAPGGVSALRVVLSYAAFAAIWIVLSDELMAWIYSDPATLVRAGIIKGWLFVAVTSLLLYAVLRCLLDRTLAAFRRELLALGLTVHLVMLALVLALPGGITPSLPVAHEEPAEARLQRDHGGALLTLRNLMRRGPEE